MNAKRGAQTAAAAVEAWHRCLERRRAGVAPDSGLDQAVAAVLPRGRLSALPAEGLRLVVGSEAVGAAEELPDEVLIGWAYDAAACETEPSGYDRLIVDLLEAGFRPVAEGAGLPAPVAGHDSAPPFRVVRARRDELPSPQLPAGGRGGDSGLVPGQLPERSEPGALGLEVPEESTWRSADLARLLARRRTRVPILRVPGALARFAAWWVPLKATRSATR